MDFPCEHTLVRHEDGTVECDGARECGCEELIHEFCVECHELGCGCAAEEHDAPIVWLEAA